MTEDSGEFQHYLPQFHLRRFAVPQREGGRPCWVSAHDRTTGFISARTGLRAIAGAKNFYTADAPPGYDPDVIEHGLLAQADSSTAQLMSKIIRQRMVAPEDRRELTALFALQHVRTAWFRDHVRRNLEEFSRREGVMRLAADGPPAGMSEAQCSLFWAHLENIATGQVSPTNGRNDILDLQLGRIQPIRDELRREWAFVFVSLPYDGFVTSDNPITLQHAVTGQFGPINVIGLHNAVEVWFPVSPCHAILVTRDLAAGPTWIDLDMRIVLDINTALHDASYRHTIWKPGSMARRLFRLLPAQGDAA